MSLSVITSRRWRPWPKVHWVVRAMTIQKGGVTVWVLRDDYEMIWPWMRCQGVGIHKGG